MVGAYDSMLILTEPCRAPAMEMEYLQAFLRWKGSPGHTSTFEAGEAMASHYERFRDQGACEARGMPRIRLHSALPLFLFSHNVDTQTVHDDECTAYGCCPSCGL
jgi:hypothetical protein